MARKQLLLDRQKIGKAKLRLYGKVRVEKDVFMKVLRKWAEVWYGSKATDGGVPQSSAGSSSSTSD